MFDVERIVVAAGRVQLAEGDAIQVVYDDDQPLLALLAQGSHAALDQQVDALDQVRDLRVEPAADLLPGFHAGLQLAGDLRQQLRQREEQSGCAQRELRPQLCLELLRVRLLVDHLGEPCEDVVEQIIVELHVERLQAAEHLLRNRHQYIAVDHVLDVDRLIRAEIDHGIARILQPLLQAEQLRGFAAAAMPCEQLRGRRLIRPGDRVEHQRHRVLVAAHGGAIHVARVTALQRDRIGGVENVLQRFRQSARWHTGRSWSGRSFIHTTRIFYHRIAL